MLQFKDCVSAKETSLCLNHMKSQNLSIALEMDPCTAQRSGLHQLKGSSQPSLPPSKKQSKKQTGTLHKGKWIPIA